MDCNTEHARDAVAVRASLLHETVMPINEDDSDSGFHR